MRRHAVLGFHMCVCVCMCVSHVLMCVVCVCATKRVCVSNRSTLTLTLPGVLGRPFTPYPQSLRMTSLAGRPAASETNRFAVSRGATRDVRAHEHLGRSIWSSLTITVYYHHVGLAWGGGW